MIYLRRQRHAAVAVVLLWLARAAAAAPPPEPTHLRVAIVAENSGAETTDLLVPLAVLRDAGIGGVGIVAVAPGPVSLMPGLTILPDATLADVATPPEVAIVPAMHDPDGPALRQALQQWAARGTLMVSICDGAWVLAKAGLLTDRAATGHWFSMSSLRRDFPATHWRQDRRWVRDGNVITSAGVSASLPVSAHLAALLAEQRLDGLEDGPPHDGARFSIGAGDVAVGAENYLLPWRSETVAVELRDGVDELALGLTVDLLNRTYAVRTVTIGDGPSVRGQRGLRIVPDAASAPEADRTVVPDRADVDALLVDIEQRYGAPTRRLVALQIEYAPGRF